MVLKRVGICSEIFKSPTIRKIMSEKASRVRNPLALFLAILIILFSPSAMALVNRVSTKIWFLDVSCGFVSFVQEASMLSLRTK